MDTSPEPFPPVKSEPAADRDAFGHWLSGFADGEGCFRLCLDRRINQWRASLRAVFQINLRYDDRAILDEIKSFWGCGAIFFCRRTPPDKPQAQFRVCRVDDLAAVVVPHFNRYPLRAKKAKDFDAWKEAVVILTRIAQRRGGWRNRKVTPEEYDEFAALKARIEQGRRYVGAVRPEQA